MKNLYNILFVAVAAMVLASCAKDETRVVALSADTATPPSLTVEYPGTAGSSETIVVDDPDNEDFVAVLNWTNANFGRDIVVEYMLEISSQGEISSATDTMSLGSGINSRTLKRSELNRWATETGQINSTDEIYLDLRIAASVALANQTVINQPDQVYSNTITIPVVPYVGEVNPDFGTPALYMIGEDFGAWSWESPDVVTMIPVSDTSDEFWCIRYLTADRGFKGVRSRRGTARISTRSAHGRDRQPDTPESMRATWRRRKADFF